MTVALWIIAVCEVIRMVQNAIQLMLVQKEKPYRVNAYHEFVDSLHETDAQFVEKMLEEFKEKHGGAE